MGMNKVHDTRIANDYKEMCRIRASPAISWVATKGKAPAVEEYLVTFRIRSYEEPGRVKDQWRVKITLPPNYPAVAPNSVMEGNPVFHPNWFVNGRWCCGTYRATESLGHYVIRMAQTLQFDAMVTNVNSPANSEAKKWYMSHSNDRSLFPSDKQLLPNPHAPAGFKKTV